MKTLGVVEVVFLKCRLPNQQHRSLNEQQLDSLLHGKFITQQLSLYQSCYTLFRKMAVASTTSRITHTCHMSYVPAITSVNHTAYKQTSITYHRHCSPNV